MKNHWLYLCLCAYLLFSTPLYAANCVPIESIPNSTALTLHNVSMQTHKDLCYTTVYENLLSYDIYAKNFNSTRHLIILVHGDHWKSEEADKRTLVVQKMPAAVASLVSSGYAVASINYRGYNDLNGAIVSNIQRSLNDVKTAIATIKVRHQIHNTFNEKVIVIGVSSGAQLASIVAVTSPGNSHIKGVISYNGPFDLRGPWDGGAVNFMFNGTTPVSFISHPKFFNNTLKTHLTRALGHNLSTGDNKLNDALYSSAQTLATQWSPIAQFSSTSVPHFFVHGTANPVVPLRHSVDAYSKLSLSGVFTDFCFVNNADDSIFPDHGDGNCWEKSQFFIDLLTTL